MCGLGWRQDEDGTWIVARITDQGLRAIGIEPNEGDAVADMAPTVAPSTEPGESPVPTAEAAQAAPLTKEIALLDQAPSRLVPPRRAPAYAIPPQPSLSPGTIRPPASGRMMAT